MPRQPEITVKVSADGRITIPKEMLDALDLKPGDEVALTDLGGGWNVRKVTPPLTREEFRAALDKWSGYLKNPDGKTSDEIVEEMRGPPLEPELRTERPA